MWYRSKSNRRILVDEKSSHRALIRHTLNLHTYYVGRSYKGGRNISYETSNLNTRYQSEERCGSSRGHKARWCSMTHCSFEFNVNFQRIPMRIVIFRSIVDFTHIHVEHACSPPWEEWFLSGVIAIHTHTYTAWGIYFRKNRAHCATRREKASTLLLIGDLWNILKYNIARVCLEHGK